MSCEATKREDITEKGYLSIEWYDNNGKPQYYCYGYIDKMTDELIDECKKCRKNVDYAQEDLHNYKKNK